MIQSHTDNEAKEALVSKLMDLPNQQWKIVMEFLVRGQDYLKQQEVLRIALNFLKLNVRACFSLGHCYISQLNRIYNEMLGIFTIYSQMISVEIQTAGFHFFFFFFSLFGIISLFFLSL